MVHLRAQWYNTRLGSFTSRDRFDGFRERPQSLHRYLYTEGNPTKDRHGVGSSSVCPQRYPPVRRHAPAMHDEPAFSAWMQHHRGLSLATCQSRLANCLRIEQFEGALDVHYAADRCTDLLRRLTYSRDDANAGRSVQHRIPISGDHYNGTATLRSALQLYIAFRNAQGGGASTAPPASAVAVPPAPRARSSRAVGTASWPAWEAPSANAILTLARTTTPYLRFLHPDIIQAVVEDTEQHRTAWSAALQQHGIPPATYLWERGACTFPGIRRYAGSSEIARHRKRLADDALPLAGALKTDDNNYPKHLWSFILRGRPFQQFGPADYQLAHLLDHKDDKPALERLNQEITHPCQQRLDVPLYGLFTSAANTVYIPKALIRPTDGTPALRMLIQRRALHLYGAACNLVPPPWALRESADPVWSLEAFAWAEPVGSLHYLKQFQALRHQHLARLLSR